MKEYLKKRLRLNSNQLETYLVMLKKKESLMADLIIELNKDRTNIKRDLDHLISKGLIDFKIENGKNFGKKGFRHIYFTVNTKEVFDNLIEEIEIEKKELIKELRKLK